jgi:LmbE family N-acetylglucosaminyl deacetylase
MAIRKILVVSPHTDDAELGCGGSIVKFLDQGKHIHWVVFSTAEESLPKSMPRNTLRLEFLNSMKQLNMPKNNLEIYNFKVRHLHEKRQNILETLISIRDRFKPTLVFIPSTYDYHQDHIVVSNECIRAFKTNASIIGYELPWNHIGFRTNLFIKLEKKHMLRKLDLLKAYKSQIKKRRNYFSREYILGLGKVRGIQCNSEYAEAFQVIRWMLG